MLTAADKKENNSIVEASRSGGIPHLLAKHAWSPKGFLGTLFGFAMKGMNKAPYRWIFDEMRGAPSGNVLEIGFGVGYGLNQLAKKNTGLTFFGLEHSAAMLHAAEKRNRIFISDQRMKLVLGSANGIPFPSNDMSHVFFVHVTYFWKNPEEEFREIYRVLKSGGKLLFFIGKQSEMSKVKMTQTGIYTIHSNQFLAQVLSATGFVNVKLTEQAIKSGPVKNGVCITAEKPSN